MKTDELPATFLLRVATLLALLLAGWSGWSVAADYWERGPADVSHQAILGAGSMVATIEAMQQQSLTAATPAARWSELFALYRAEAERLAALDPVAARAVDAASVHMTGAEGLRTSLMVSSLEAERRRQLETGFRTTLGKAAATLDEFARGLRQRSVVPEQARRVPLDAVVLCLGASLLAGVLLLERAGLAGALVRKPPHPQEDTADMEPSVELAGERLAAVAGLRFCQLMTPVTGYSELLLDSLAPEDPLRRDVEQIQFAGRRATALARHLQAFGRQEESDPVVFDLREWFREQQEGIQLAAGIAVAVRVETSGPPCLVQADQRQLRGIVEEIAVNASEAMAGEGELEVRVSPVERAGEAMVLASFTDTGKGMVRETRLRIFEPLFSTKPPGRGAGLGLTAALAAVQRFGGAIEVSSTAGKGATVRVYWPRLVQGSATGEEPRIRAASA